MKLAQAIQAGPAPDPRRRCGVGDWIDTLDDEDREAFEATLALARRREGWTISSLHVLLVKDAAFPLGPNMLGKHAAEKCSCATR